MDVVIADIFDEQGGALADLALDHEGRFGREFVDGVGGRDEICLHTLRPQPPSNSHDHGNCRWGCTPRPAIALVPVGSPPPNVAERSIFPGNVLNLPFDRGSDVGEPRIGPAGQGVEEGGNVGQNLRGMALCRYAAGC
jgi:hypothetical protein